MPTVVFYYCMLIAIFVLVTFLYEVYKVSAIHYPVTINTNPFHPISGEDILQILII